MVLCYNKPLRYPTTCLRVPSLSILPMSSRYMNAPDDVYINFCTRQMVDTTRRHNKMVRSVTMATAYFDSQIM
jgi:hypothetical protein